MFRAAFAVLATVIVVSAVAPRSHAQSIAQRVAQANGVLDIVYPSRDGVCGDGRGMIGHLFGQGTRYNGISVSRDRRDAEREACERGPARVEVSVASGEVTRLRTFVGPVRSASSNSQTINTTAADAGAWLSDLVATGSGRIASDAMLPLLVANGSEPWPLFLRVARDETRSRATRGTALIWLGNGVAEKLGLSDADDRETEEDELRQQAVFVLTQRPKSESVPELIDLAKHGKYPSVRRSAIFWLGQTGDPRAADTFAELLSGR